MARYTFSCSEYDGESGSQFPVEKDVNVTLTFHDEATWDAILDEFISFLGGIYGYDIHKSVKYLKLEEKIKAMRLDDDCDGLEERKDGSTIDLEDDDEIWRKIL